MDKTFYQNMLKREPVPPEVAEAHWDARAAHFSATQSLDRTGLTDLVVAFLNEKNLLKGAAVLDIGGGSGRYAIPFAKEATHVTMTDISENMLKHARENAEAKGLHNLDYVKLDWERQSLKALNWEEHYDLVFASMCPAVRSEAGLDNMIHASKGYCMINQFISDEDSVEGHLEQTFGLARRHNPHRDRRAVQAYFNLLWLEGYEPEIQYIHTQETYTLSIVEAVERYGGRYESIIKEKGVNFSEWMESYASNDVIEVVRKSTLAMILWRVSE